MLAGLPTSQGFLPRARRPTPAAWSEICGATAYEQSETAADLTSSEPRPRASCADRTKKSFNSCSKQTCHLSRKGLSPPVSSCAQETDNGRCCK